MYVYIFKFINYGYMDICSCFIDVFICICLYSCIQSAYIFVLTHTHTCIFLQTYICMYIFIHCMPQ